jgi:hypothetical protein
VSGVTTLTEGKPPSRIRLGQLRSEARRQHAERLARIEAGNATDPDVRWLREAERPTVVRCGKCGWSTEVPGLEAAGVFRRHSCVNHRRSVALEWAYAEGRHALPQISEETRQKMIASQRGKLSPLRGRVMPEEHRRRIGEGQKRRHALQRAQTAR